MPSLQERVNWYLASNFSNVVVRLCMSAIHVFMLLYMTSFYLEASPETRKRRLPYIIASVVVLVLSFASSTLLALQTYNTLFDIQPGLEDVEQVTAIITRHEDRFLYVRSLLADCAYRVGEFVLLYRCYQVWFDRRWVTLLPTCIFLADIGINLRTYIPLDFNDPKLNIADSLLLVATNVLLTSLITFRLIQAQKRLTSVLPDTDHKVYLGIVGILIESAAPLAIFSVAAAVANLYAQKSFRAMKAFYILGPLASGAAVLAPQLVIFRVATGTSWADKNDTSAMLSRPIEFKAPAQTGSDEEIGLETSER